MKTSSVAEKEPQYNGYIEEQDNVKEDVVSLSLRRFLKPSALDVVFVPSPEEVPDSEFEERQERLRAAMRLRGIDAAFLYSDHFNGAYTSYYGRFKPNDTSAAIFLPVEGEPTLAVQSEGGNVPKAKAWSPIRDIVTFQEFFERGGQPGIRKIAIQAYQQCLVPGMNILPWTLLKGLGSTYPDAELTDGHDLVTPLMQVMSDNEIALMRKAAEIGDASIMVALETIDVGVTEIEVSAAGQCAAVKRGGEILCAFLVASYRWPGDPNVIRASKISSHKKIERGDTVHMDFHLGYKGYMNDVARLVHTEGAPEEATVRQQRRVEALEAMIKSIKPGMEVRELAQVAAPILGYVPSRFGETMGLYGCMGSSFEGGMGVMGAGGLTSDLPCKLRPNICLDLGLGGIETIVLVTKTGAEKLNRAPFIPK